MRHTTKRLIPTAAVRALAQSYTLEHCNAILEQDPAGCERLIQIAHGTLPRDLSKRLGRRRSKPRDPALKILRTATGQFL